MKGSMFLIAATVYLLVCGALAEDQCKAGEVYKECADPCPETCENLGHKPMCKAVCKPGCNCEDGLVRSDEGECIPPEDCETHQCEENQEYQECGYPCDRVCLELAKVIKCSKNCTSGCFCKEGYLRTKDGKCVPPQNCEEYLCEEGEEFTNCGSSCPDTCENFGDDFICTAECVRGCFCRKGLVRNANGKCIPLSECENKYCPQRYTYVCFRSINQCCSDEDCGEGHFCCRENCGNTCHPFTDVRTNGRRVMPNSDCVIDETYAKAGE